MKSKKAKHWLINILIALIASGAVAALTYSYIKTMEARVAAEISLNLSEVAAQGVMRIEERVGYSLSILSSLSEVVGEDGSKINALTAKTLLKNNYVKSNFDLVSIVDLDGQVYSWNGKYPPNKNESLIFNEILSQEPPLIRVTKTLEDNRDVLAMGLPIRHNGQVIGAILGRCYMDKMESLFALSSFGGDGYNYISDRNGHIVVNSYNANAMKNFKELTTDFQNCRFQNRSDFDKMILDIAAGKSGELLYTCNTIPRIMNYTPLGFGDLYLLSVVPQEVVVQRSAYLYRQAAWLIMALLVVFAFVLAYVFYLKRQGQQRLKTANHELSTLYNTIPGGIFRCRMDERWTILFANNSFYRFIGYSKEELSSCLGNELAQIIHPDDLESIQRKLSLETPPGTILAAETRLVCSDGHVKWIWVNCEQFQDAEKYKSLYCTLIDITQLKEIQEELKVTQQRYEIIMDRMQDTIFEWNIQEDSIYFASNFNHKFGYEPPKKDFPQSLTDSNRIFEGDIGEYLNIFCRILEGERFSEGEVRFIDADGVSIWCKIAATALLDKSGRPFKVVGVISDIEAQKRKLQIVEESAMRDSLTNLYNKGTTERLVEAALQNASTSCSLLVIDIDNFKGVNDTLGHLYGDALLTETAHSLCSLFRSSDIIGRVGGDEFVVFLSDISEDSILFQKAEAVTEVFRKSLVQCSITCSIGIARSPQNGVTFSELFEKADVALYFAKNHGKSQYAVYSDSISGENSMVPYSRVKLSDKLLSENELQSYRENSFESIKKAFLQIYFEFPTLEGAVPRMFDLVGHSFELSRIYLCELSEDEKFLYNFCEWCGSGVKPVMEKSVWISSDSLPANDHPQSPVFLCEDLRRVTQSDAVKSLRERGVISTLIYDVRDSDRRLAVIGFEEFSQGRRPTHEEMDIVRHLGKTIAMYLKRSREPYPQGNRPPAPEDPAQSIHEECSR